MTNVVPFTKHQKVLIPYDLKVDALLPSARKVDYKGQPHLAVHHRLEETKLLRNLGYKVDSPIKHYYGWSGVTPFRTQVETAAMLTLSPRAYVLNNIGTGKTCAALFAFDYLRTISPGLKMLVVAPLSTLTAVWEREVFARFSHLHAVALFGTRKKRLKLLEEPADIYIINHDGIATIKDELAEKNFPVVTIDELAVYRNASTKRWKMAKPLVSKALYAWGMTGAPTPNEPTDAWGQVRLLTPDNVHYSRTKFKQQVMKQVSTFRWIPRPEANDIVHEAMQPAVRYTRDDSFDMPPTTIGYRDVEMTRDQKSAYKNMMDQFAVQVKDKQITAANEGVKISKLLQIASGFIYDASGKQAILPSNPRFKLLLELIEETDNKVIVFTPFKFSVKMLARVLNHVGHSVECVSGDTPKGERDRIFNLFQNAKDPHIIVAHPSCMAHGLTLTEADTVIWFAPIWSTETYEQACGRITRAGQDKHTHILHIVGSPVEKKIYKRLENKQKCQGLLLDMFKGETL